MRVRVQFSVSPFLGGYIFGSLPFSLSCYQIPRPCPAPEVNVQLTGNVAKEEAKEEEEEEEDDDDIPEPPEVTRTVRARIWEGNDPKSRPAILNFLSQISEIRQFFCC